MSTLRSERGSVSLYAVWISLALTLLALTMVEAGALIAMRHRSAAAADLSALAASRAGVNGQDGCDAARRAAAANHARITECRMDYDVVATVTARTESSRWWGHRWAAETAARAAPSDYLP